MFTRILLCLALFLPAWAQQPATFDYYVLSLSWSPEFCHSNAASPECSGPKHYGFIVHGLWPESQNGGGPEHCSDQPLQNFPPGLSNIMPDSTLIQHEWLTHGTCSGLSSDAYFTAIAKAFQSIHIPSEFAAPSRQITESPLEIKQAFERANPGLTGSDIAVTCGGSYLRSVSICLSKSLRPVACTAVNDCRARILRIPPVRPE